jgi:hypothetical protein
MPNRIRRWGVPALAAPSLPGHLDTSTGHRGRVVALVSILTMCVCFGAALAAPPFAHATVERWYCENGLVGYDEVTSSYPGTCPPAGSSEWLHLNENAGYGEIHTSCVDDYLDPDNNGYYTGQTCAKAETFAEIKTSHVWGYPRIWNDYCCSADRDNAFEYES